MTTLSPKQLELRKLNLASGFDKRSGYLNVDFDPNLQPDVLADVLDLKGFPSRHYEEIIAQDILEHFKRTDTRRALYEWNRLLAARGNLSIRTTYLNGLVHRLESQPFQSVSWQEHLLRDLFSNQLCEGDYHLTAFTETLLRYYLWECGFAIVHLWVRDEWLFECAARKVKDYSFEELVTQRCDDERFVSNAYQAILFRPADETGRPYLLQQLREKRLSRRDAVRFLLTSEERKQLMLRQAPDFPRQFDPCRAA